MRLTYAEYRYNGETKDLVANMKGRGWVVKRISGRNLINVFAPGRSKTYDSDIYVGPIVPGKKMVRTFTDDRKCQKFNSFIKGYR